MIVSLIDLDICSLRMPFPNLALMKLSTFHKRQGDEVYLNFLLCQPDIVYASCIFTWYSKKAIGLPESTIIGGSGIDLTKELPYNIEHIMPDYTLYPNINFSLGFTSRGCIRQCPFCVVPEKEGCIKPWTSIYEFWDRRTRKIVLFDNNLLAAPNWKETLTSLIKEGIEIDFNQGLDIRLLNEENVSFLARIKTKILRFAFDHISYERSVREGLKLLLDAGFSARRLSFYLLVGFEKDDTAIERAEILKSYNVDIYPMVYKGIDGKEPKLKPAILSLTGFHGNWHNLRKFQRVVSKK